MTVSIGKKYITRDGKSNVKVVYIHDRGERPVVVFAENRDGSVCANVAVWRASLTGRFKPPHENGYDLIEAPEEKPALTPDDYYDAFVYKGHRNRSEGNMTTYESITRDALGGSVSCSRFYKMYKNKKGELHRTDGPAVQQVDGYRAWYFENKRHRIGGPAIIDSDGSQQWWVNDKLHRTDGPAIVYAERCIITNVKREWWVDGELIKKE
jgi:hypothetical protein